MIAQGNTAPVACVGHPREFTPAISAELVGGLMIGMMIPEAVVIFGQVMLRAEVVPAPPARIGKLVKYFPAIVATVH